MPMYVFYGRILELAGGRVKPAEGFVVVSLDALLIRKGKTTPISPEEQLSRASSSGPR